MSKVKQHTSHTLKVCCSTFDIECTWWMLFYFWLWVYLMNVVLLLTLSVPDKCCSTFDFECICWMLFYFWLWVYLINVILETRSVYLFSCPLYCLYINLRLLISTLESSNICFYVWYIYWHLVPLASSYELQLYPWFMCNCLTCKPLYPQIPVLFDCYRGQFYWWRKQEYTQKSTDQLKVIGETLSHKTNVWRFQSGNQKP
jgi:hypothetical protein